MCAVMFIPVGGVESSSTVVVAPELRHLVIRQQTSTGVLATTDPNLLIYGSTAVAKGTAVDRQFRRLGSVADRKPVDVCCRRYRFADC